MSAKQEAGGPAVVYSYLRFSRPEQAKGGSVRRQTELRDAWLARSEAVLDTSVSLRDDGKSAFTGEHRKNPDQTEWLRQISDSIKPIAGADETIEKALKRWWNTDVANDRGIMGRILRLGESMFSAVCGGFKWRPRAASATLGGARGLRKRHPPCAAT